MLATDLLVAWVQFKRILSDFKTQPFNINRDKMLYLR